MKPMDDQPASLPQADVNASAPSDAPVAPRRGMVRRLFHFARDCLAIIGLVLLAYHLCFDLSTIISPSMAPTLQGTSQENGDWVLTEKLSYRFRRPRRWELVKFHNNDGLAVMKRVVALPRERIRLENGKAVVNGVAQTPPASLSFLHYHPYGPLLRNGQEASCGDGYFVFGDDAKDSFDSRFEGAVPPRRIEGRPWLIVWPLSRFGFVNP